MREQRTCKMYFDDILLAIDRILEYTEGYNFIRFKRDYKTVDAVIRNFEIIGEATKNIPEAIKEEYSNIPWTEMYSLRNRVSHAYFGIDYEIIWDIITNYLPNNKEEIKKIQESIY
ncbi:MAG: DUF86 domain-containing protein [Dysgonamonadaceae bacterium]|jgi:uncharacterized protein with HEPN domain|nr:DUF86 domain-containing protein [Dysgonamonadaceae bacterium]